MPRKKNGTGGVVEFTHGRLEDLIQALSFAAIDDFEACMALMKGTAEGDSFAELEGKFTEFLGELVGAKSALNDALVRAEEANRELETKLEMIERQQAAIRELSTPIIEVWAGVLPLRITPGEPIPEDDLPADTPLPGYLSGWSR